MRMAGGGFDLEGFIADCRAAVREDRPQPAVRAVVERAMADRAALVAALGEPRKAQIQKLYTGSDITVLNLIWAPGMRFIPHNHGMWATIGIYDGQEDNVFWRRIEGAPDGLIEVAGGKTLVTGDVTTLGAHVVHSVTNPSSRFTGAIHVYGGDFFGAERSEWDPQALSERPYNVPNAIRAFEEANAGLGTAG
jgi:predicted metal-dependent enzyme (double-stranded beta helix superfamily)